MILVGSFFSASQLATWSNRSGIVPARSNGFLGKVRKGSVVGLSGAPFGFVRIVKRASSGA